VGRLTGGVWLGAGGGVGGGGGLGGGGVGAGEWSVGAGVGGGGGLGTGGGGGGARLNLWETEMGGAVCSRVGGRVPEGVKGRGKGEVSWWVDGWGGGGEE